MPEDSKPFVVARNKYIAPKERRVERVPPGYAVREFYNNSQGCYWYVVTALEVVRADKCPTVKEDPGGRGGTT